MIEPETPEKHFRKCGPFCPHVELCRDCANVYGLCAKHRNAADHGIAWKQVEPEQKP